jgi:exonuclease III
MRAQSGSYERLLVGDLNVVERGHMPYYPFFQEWEYAFLDTLSVCGLIDAFRLLTPSDCEYSWMDRNGDGYRYDHSFVEASAAPAVRSCSYAHATREERLSDHSAMALDVKVDAVIPSRDVQVLTSLQPSLF